MGQQFNLSHFLAVMLFAGAVVALGANEIYHSQIAKNAGGGGSAGSIEGMLTELRSDPDIERVAAAEKAEQRAIRRKETYQRQDKILLEKIIDDVFRKD